MVKNQLSKIQIELMPCIFSDLYAMKLEVDHKKKIGKTRNTWILKNTKVKELMS